MLQIIYNSTPLWDYFIDNCNKKHDNAFIKLQRKQNFFASRNLFARLINLCIGKYIDFGYRYVIDGDFCQIKKSDTILLLGIYNYTELVHLRKKFQGNKMVLWLWNPVGKTYRRNASRVITNLKKMGYDIFTFDANDAKKYQLGLRPQFTMLPIECDTDENSFKHDVYFLGQPKGREAMLEKIRNEYSSLGIDCFFKIVLSASDYISYEENIKNVIESKSVLEICQEGQRGLTLRALEAMLCHRKLITNNQSIVIEDFYNSQNIFVIGKDNNDNIKEFVDSEFVIGDERILIKYDFNNWLTFFENEKL